MQEVVGKSWQTIQKVQLSQLLHFITDGMKWAEITVGNNTFQDVVEGICDFFDLAGHLLQLSDGIQFFCDKDDFSPIHASCFFVMINKKVSNRREVQSVLEGLFTDPYVLTVFHAGRQNHIPFRDDLESCEVQSPDGLIGLVRVLDGIDMKKGNSGENRVILYFGQISPVEENTVLLQKFAVAGDGIVADTGPGSDAELVGGISLQKEFIFFE